MLTVVRVTFNVVLCFLTHELSHFLAALVFGYTLRFRFAWGRFYVPRLVWDMPDAPRWQQRVIALSGFGGEAVCAGLCAGWIPAAFFMLHLGAYPLYAGEDSDFNWI